MTIHCLDRSYSPRSIALPSDPQGEALALLQDVYRLTVAVTKDTSLKIDQNLKDLLTDLAKIIELVTKNKVDEIKKELDSFIKKLEKQKKASVFQKFLKALGVVALALAVVSAVVTPSPATLVLLAITVAMVLEPMISEAAGSKSLVERGMSEMMKFFSDKMGTTGGAVFAALLTCLIVMFVANGAPAFIARFASSAANSVSKGFLAKIHEFLKMIMKDQKTLAAFHAIFNSAESGVLLAQGVLQMELSEIRLEIAKNVKAGDLSRADSQMLIQILEMLQNLLENKQNFRTSHRASSASLFVKPL